MDNTLRRLQGDYYALYPYRHLEEVAEERKQLLPKINALRSAAGLTLWSEDKRSA